MKRPRASRRRSSRALGAQDQGPRVNWVPGPAKVDLGKVAQLDLAEGYVFLDAKDARTLLEAAGNTPDGSEVGLVSAAAEDQNWFVIFDYSEVGYDSDSEKDKIDADALLKGIKEGTEESNAVRKEKGIPGLHVVGWQQPPSYGAGTHNLSWAILAKDDTGDQVVNFNIRLLGRRGYMSATLVDDPSKIAAARPHLDRILADLPANELIPVLGVLLLILAGFGFKISAVPFHFWAPDVYEGAPTPVAGFLSTASKAAGFAVLLRVFVLVFPGLNEYWGTILAVLAVVTMTLGNLLALAQKNIKRLLAYSSIAHAGYILIGVVAFSSLGFSSVVFYLGAYLVTNLAAFGAVTIFAHVVDSDEIYDYAGLSRRSPGLALAMLVARSGKS